MVFKKTLVVFAYFFFVFWFVCPSLRSAEQKGFENILYLNVFGFFSLSELKFMLSLR